MRAALASLALLAGCAAPVHVDTQTPVGAAVPAFQTYTMAPAPAPSRATPTYDAETTERLEATIASILDEKGYHATSARDADVRVSYLVHRQASEQLINAGDPRANYYVPDLDVASTIAIEIADAKSGALLWKDSGKVEIHRGSLVHTRPQQAELEAVRAILAKLPARP